jgi:PIN domain nuclease of toxin-antitoxin system
MRVLLDTHLLLWALAQPAKLPPGARKLIDTAEVMVSAASIWEIGIKSALGKLTLGPLDILQAIEPTGFGLLSVTGEHAARVGELPPLHRDPFDRMLVAQALPEPLILLTNDQLLVGYGSCVTLV